MSEKAGSRYETEVRSGGVLSRFLGGGLIGPARARAQQSEQGEAAREESDGSFMGTVSGNRGLFSRMNPVNSAQRQEALREGEVRIKDTETGKIVWQYSSAKLPMGMDESKFLDEIEQDLENMNVEDFQKRWGIAP